MPSEMDASGKPILAKPPRLVMRASAVVLVVATATILTALAFEHLGGYAPCPLCLEERYAYYFAVPASALAVLLARAEQAGLARILLLLIALAFLANVGLASIMPASSGNGGRARPNAPAPSSSNGARAVSSTRRSSAATRPPGASSGSPSPAGTRWSRPSSPASPLGRGAAALARRLTRLQASVIGGRVSRALL